MNQGQQFLAGWFTPVGGNLPSLPEKPEHPPWGKPIQPLPPLPPVDPPIDPPEVDDGATPEHPIFLPDKPNLPPGFVWPPFNPGDGIQGKALLLCWVPGVGKKWIVVDVPSLPGTWPPEGWPPAGGIGGTPPPRPGGGPTEPQPKGR